MVKTYRYGINRGEEAVTLDINFKRFDLVLDFRGFNYCKVKINSYTRNLLWRNRPFSNRFAFLSPLAGS
jgi:hypothetical protein